MCEQTLEEIIVSKNEEIDRLKDIIETYEKEIKILLEKIDDIADIIRN